MQGSHGTGAQRKDLSPLMRQGVKSRRGSFCLCGDCPCSPSSASLAILQSGNADDSQEVFEVDSHVLEGCPRSRTKLSSRRRASVRFAEGKAACITRCRFESSPMFAFQTCRLPEAASKPPSSTLDPQVFSGQSRKRCHKKAPRAAKSRQVQMRLLEVPIIFRP